MTRFNVHRVRFFEYFPQAIHCITYDEKQNKIALSRADHSVEIWSLENNWFQEKTIRNSGDASIEGLVWAQGRLFSAGLCCDVTEYDLNALQIKQTTPSYSGAIWCLTCNLQHTNLAAGTEEGCITLFDIEDGALRFLRSFDKQEGRILCLAWHPGGDCLVTGGVDNIRVWSANSGRARQRLTLQRHQRQKEVLVWCVAVTKDMTIISGDSCGRTIFWNGKQGTQLKSFSAHRADVQALCVDASGTRAYSSGVDPLICQFDLVNVTENSDLGHWVKTQSKTRTNHDIRALALTKTHLVAGGVDAYLAHAQLSAQGTLPIRLIQPIPQRSLVSTSNDGLMLLQFNEHLEVWKLGSTDSKSGSPGAVLPLSSQPVKLCVLKVKDDEKVTCSTLSRDSKWLAYCDRESMRLFHLDADFEDLFQPKVSLTRVRYRPPELLRARCLQFTADGSTLVSGAVDGSIQIIRVDTVQPSVQHTFPSSKRSPEPVSILSLSADSSTLAAVSDHNVYLYSLRDYEQIGTLPKLGAQPTALCLNRDGKLLLVAYADRKIVEFEVQSRKFSKWSRQTMSAWPRFWLNNQSAIRNVQYNPANQHQILAQDVTSLAIIDQSLPFTSLHTNKKKKDNRVEAIKMCNNYKLLLHAEILPENWMIVVERPEHALVQALPDALQRKKFGT